MTVCTPYVDGVFDKGYNVIIHTSSANAITASLEGDMFVSTLQSFKVGNYSDTIQDELATDIFQDIDTRQIADEKVVLPIIDNRDVEQGISELINSEKFLGATAVLVKGHGIFVWASRWEEAVTRYVQLISQTNNKIS